MDHELDGKKPSDRVSAAGYDWRWVGENIAWGEEPPPAEKIFKDWMDSPHHKENILRKEYKEIGIGRATPSFAKLLRKKAAA